MKYRFRTPPRPYQVEVLKRLIRQGGGGMQVPMRWGKTKLAIDWASCMHLKHGVTRVLVICPVSALGVWPQQVAMHQPEGIDLEWRVVNFEAAYSRKQDKRTGGYRMTERRDLIEFAPEIVIVDESHRIGNPTTKQSRFVYKLGRMAKHRLFMTGTMFHRKPFYVFGQAKFYDPAVFGTSFKAFKQRIAIFGGYGGYVVQKYVNLEWMMDCMKEFTHIEKYVPPEQPPIHTMIPFKLTGKGLEYYKEMEREDIIEVGDATIVSPIVLSRHLRLQQIAGGWVKVKDGKYRRVGDDLFRVGTDLLQQYADAGVERIVIGCRFVPEIKDACEAAQEAGFARYLIHGAVKKEHRPQMIEDWATCPEPAVLVCQISAAKEAIDLSAADTMIFWSLSPDFVDHEQFSKRIELYDEKRTLRYDYLVPEGTRTEVTYDALTEKQDVARWIAEDPRRVERITSKLEA